MHNSVCDYVILQIYFSAQCHRKMTRKLSEKKANGGWKNRGKRLGKPRRRHLRFAIQMTDRRRLPRPLDENYTIMASTLANCALVAVPILVILPILAIFTTPPTAFRPSSFNERLNWRILAFGLHFWLIAQVFSALWAMCINKLIQPGGNCTK